MKTQSEATINAVINYCKDKNIEATPFETVYKDVLKDDDRQVIVNMIFEGLQNEEISMTEKSKEKFANDPKALRRYVVGLVNDRLRKAKALNGNTKYEYKEPGKLTASRDPQLKALTQVLELHKGTDNEADIQAAIDARQAEITAEKAKAVDINYDVLPNDLLEKLGINTDELDHNGDGGIPVEETTEE